MHLSQRLWSQTVRGPSIRPSIIYFFYSSSWWILMKLGRDQVQALLEVFLPDTPKIRSWTGKNRSQRGDNLLRQTGRLRQQTQIHSIDIDACGKNCCLFWFDSEVNFFLRFLMSIWTWQFTHIFMQFLYNPVWKNDKTASILWLFTCFCMRQFLSISSLGTSVLLLFCF